LLLVVFNKMGLLNQYIKSDLSNFYEFLSDKILDINEDFGFVIWSAIVNFKSDISNIEKSYLTEFINLFETQDLSDKEFFDELMLLINEVLGMSSLVSMQPIELTRLMVSIANINEGGIIYNPFAGVNSIGINFQDSVNVLSQENNPRVYSLGIFRAIAHNKESYFDFKCSNSINEWQNGLYDCIIASPPFNLKLPNEIKSLEFKTLYSFIIEKSINSLKPNGKLILVVPNNFLFSSDADSIKSREKIIKRGLLESIISFPSGILKTSGVELNLLVLSMGNKKNPFLIKANNIILPTSNNKIKIIDSNKLLDIYNNRTETNYSKYIEYDEFVNNEYSLHVNRYFVEKVDGIRLGDIIEPISRKKIKENENLPFVGISDLSSSLNNTISFNQDYNEVSHSSLAKLDRSAILIANAFNDLKPTYVEIEKTPIAYKNNIQAFSLKNNVLPRYLINELNKDYVKEQIKAIQYGSVVKQIRTKDFLEVKVKIPSINEQQAVLFALDELSNKFSSLEKEKEALLKGERVDKFKEFGSIKHSTGTARQSILDWSILLSDFLKKEEFKLVLDDLETKFKSEFNTGIIDTLETIKESIESITRILMKGENGLVIENYPLSKISIKELYKIVSKLNNPNYKFQVITDLLIENDLTNRGILANIDLLQILLNNILENANKHAFNQTDRTNNVLKIELNEVNGVLFLEVKDNGEGFNLKIDTNFFKSRFKTTAPDKGFGEGGYTIDRISKYFGDNDWKLTLDKNDAYPVKFLFNFKIISIG